MDPGYNKLGVEGFESSFHKVSKNYYALWSSSLVVSKSKIGDFVCGVLCAQFPKILLNKSKNLIIISCSMFNGGTGWIICWKK